MGESSTPDRARPSGTSRGTARTSAAPDSAGGIRFDADLRRRLGSFALRVRGARERREGAGGARLFGVGTEFVGHRPYRPGEDLRLFDWQLYARLRRPFVRVARREASEHWAIALDTSASMGVGASSKQLGKLQSAAEVASAIAVSAIAVGASVELWTSGRARLFRMQKKADLSAWLAFLEEESAEGGDGLSALLAEPARVRAAGRVFLLGDFLDVEPPALFGLVRRGRELFCGQVLARSELTPQVGGAVEWLDPETEERYAVERTAENVERYERALAERLEGWRAFAARHRARFITWSSERAFEEVTTELLGF